MMKKIAIVAGFALLGTVVLPSCKKEYSCSCKDAKTGQGNTEVASWKTTKADAKRLCDQLEVASQGALECSID